MWERVITQISDLYFTDYYALFGNKQLPYPFSKDCYKRQRASTRYGKIIIENKKRKISAPYLSTELYMKLIDAGCQIEEYTIEDDQFLLDESIFTNKLFANYVTETLKENIILPYI